MKTKKMWNMDDIFEYLSNVKKEARERLAGKGYFDENWETLRELVGDDINSAYLIGKYEAVYELADTIIALLEEIKSSEGVKPQ